MDGIEVAAAIESDPALRDLAVVMLTSVGHKRELSRAGVSRVDAALIKPVRPTHLLNTLATAWSRKSSTPQAIHSAHPPAPANRGGDLSRELAGITVRVLVAEDNPVNQKVASLILGKLGIRPDLAPNGRQAVDMFEKGSYDLIFMDCQMPELDGYAAAREIRLREKIGRRVRIVAMTAEALAGSRELCLEAGMDGYIAKPVKFDEVFKAIEEWLRLKEEADRSVLT
jgi:two-component system, sensor histidine kinase and response regulator